MSQLGQLAGKAAVAGYGVLWGTQRTFTCVWNPAPGKPNVAFDYATGVVIVDGDDRVMDAFEFAAAYLKDAENTMTGESSRGHWHAEGAENCRICKIARRPQPEFESDGPSCPRCSARQSEKVQHVAGRFVCRNCATLFIGNAEEWEANRFNRQKRSEETQND